MSDVQSAIMELQGKIGVEWEPEVVDIERSLIHRVARAVGDSNPLW